MNRLANAFLIMSVLSLSDLVSPAVQARENPVVLVHGLGDKARKMRRLAKHLKEEGREVHNIVLSPSWGQVRLEALASQVADFVETELPGSQRFDLVGFSMGGLVSRYYLQRLGGLDRVDRFVTISTPHHGSVLAWLIPNPGCRQMRPGSAFLDELNRDAHSLSKLQFTSFWTPLDLTVIPARSSVIPAAQCEQIWCVAHPLMVAEPRCLKAVAEVLRRPLNREAVVLN